MGKLAKTFTSLTAGTLLLGAGACSHIISSETLDDEIYHAVQNNNGEPLLLTKHKTCTKDHYIVSVNSSFSLASDREITAEALEKDKELYSNTLAKAFAQPFDDAMAIKTSAELNASLSGEAIQVPTEQDIIWALAIMTESLNYISQGGLIVEQNWTQTLLSENPSPLCSKPAPQP